jgi:cytochrome c553
MKSFSISGWSALLLLLGLCAGALAQLAPKSPLAAPAADSPAAPNDRTPAVAVRPPNEPAITIDIEEFRRSPPRVQSIAITPLAGPQNARLTVQYLLSERLPKELPIEISDNRVVLRADGDGRYSANIRFDFEAFIKEQTARKVLARRGAVVPVFKGRHFLNQGRVQFIEPDAIRLAMRNLRPIFLSAAVVNGVPIIVDPDRELLITDVSVVEDPARTYDVCTQQGTKMGAWTFGKLMTEIFNGQDAASMVENWLSSWNTDQTVNGFTVPNRHSGIQALLGSGAGSWPRVAGSNKLDLSDAPMRLLAIVNRVDLRKAGAYGGGNAGEARFVFGVVRCPFARSFTVILEYGVPKSACSAIQDWAQQWHNLGSIDLGTAAYNNALQAITNQFAGPNVVPANPNGSALNQLRTNEIDLAGPWELREFRLSASTHQFIESTIAQTPDDQFRQSVQLKDFIDANQFAIIGDRHTVPLTFQGAPFLGGNAFSTFSFWKSVPAENSNVARHHFSQATCDGCHGRETNTAFLHVKPREAGDPAELSKFLIGSLGTAQAPLTQQVTDPVDSSISWQQGDLLRRQQDLASLIESGCLSGGIGGTVLFDPLNTPD